MKERVELAHKNPSFWQNYKFMNPSTKQVEPKQMYCERLNETMPSAAGSTPLIGDSAIRT